MITRSLISMSDTGVDQARWFKKEMRLSQEESREVDLDRNRACVRGLRGKLRTSHYHE